MANRSIELTLKSNVHGLVTGLKTAQTAASNAGRDLDSFRKNNEQAWNAAGTAAATGGAAILAGVGLVNKAAMDWETAWAGVNKTVDGTPEQMAALEGELRNLATTLPSTHTEIAAVAEAAGQLGIAREDVSSFTRTMIDLGETTNLTAEEAATSLAQFMNIMGTSAADIDNLGSSLVALGNDGASTEKDILDMATRVAAVGAQMGMTEAEVMGLSSAMASLGIESEAGGTAISMVMKKIDSSVREGGDSLTGWAEAAGVSAEEFAEAWQNRPAEAMVMLTSGLGEVAANGGDVNAMLADLGIKGIREADTMLRLAQSGDLLAESFETGSESFASASALADEAAKRYETAESRIAVSWNKIKDAAIDAGGAMLPAVAGIAEAAGGIAEAFGALPDPVKGGLGVLGGVTGAAGVAAGGLMLLTPRIVETVDAFKQLAPAGSKARGALSGLGKAGLIGTGVAILGGALIEVANASQPAAAGLEEVANQLLKFQETQDIGNIDELFDFSGVGPGAQEIQGLAEAFNALDPSNPAEHIASFGATVMNISNIPGQAADAINTLDQALATMDTEQASDNMNNLRMEMEAAGRMDLSSWSSMQELFPEYTAGIEAAANATGEATSEADLFQAAMGNLPPHMRDTGEAGIEAADGVGLAGESMEESAEAAEELADATKEALDGLREMGVIPRDAQAANDAYQASIDALTESLKENGKTLDDTTDKGRNNRQAMRDHADAGVENAAAMAEVGASQEEIQAQLSSTYEDLVKAGEGFGLSSAAADLLARDMLNIPETVDIETWMSEEAANVAQYTADTVEMIPGNVQIIANMSEDALNKAFETAAAIAVIPGYKRVDVAVDDQGTPGQIQSRVNAITGKTEFVFVQDDGTSQYVQQQILNIDGKDVPVYVKEDGTVVVTQGKIDGIHGKNVTVYVGADTSAAKAAINSIQGKRVNIDVVRRNLGQAGVATGGIAGLGYFPKHAKGRLPGYAMGRLPYTGRGTDRILGVNAEGWPVARVDDGEGIINERSTVKHLGLLSAINDDDPKRIRSLVAAMPGYANGRTSGHEWSASSMAASAMRSGPVSASVDSAVIGAAVASAIASYQPVVKIGMREFIGEMKQDRAWKGNS